MIIFPKFLYNTCNKVLRRRNITTYISLLQKKKKQIGRRLRACNFKRYWRKSMCGNSRSWLKKEWNFQGCSCVISTSFGFWFWNFQGASLNFAEFSWVKAFSKVANLNIPVGFFRKVYPQPPSLIVFFSGIAHWQHESWKVH